MEKINYWVVGATFGDTDMYDEFIENGIWYMGWGEAQKSEYRISQFFDRIYQIKNNDRIAIKRLLGQGQTEIRIMGVGIVRKVIKEVFFVDWIVKDMDRHVPINGCVGTIYGPFSYADDWTREIFCI